MGASHSKKRRKEKRKRKKFSPNFEIPRSASVDAIRVLGVSPPLSSVGHCQHSLSWSDSVDHSWQHHRCPYGQQENLRVGHENCESFPDCNSFYQQNGELSAFSRTSQHMRGGQCDISTMSLNRLFTNQPSNVNRNTTHSSSFTPLDCIDHRTGRESINQSDTITLLLQSTPPPRQKCPGSMPSKPDSLSVYSSPHGPFTNSQHLFPLSSPLAADKDKNSNSLSNSDSNVLYQDNQQNVLDDEDSMLSRSVKRKQMAQQLRQLRLHLEQAGPRQLDPLVIPGRKEENLRDECPPTTPNNKNIYSCNHLDEDPPKDQAEKPAAECSNPTEALPASPTRRTLRSKFSRMSNYRYLDDHPVLTRLQNEQNNRLESMERRMKEIRISAMQEAERRKFAEIFPAKNDDSETQRMLEEARETLKKLKEEKRRKLQASQGQQAIITSGKSFQKPNMTSGDRGEEVNKNELPVNDAGEIIPVCLVPRRNFQSSQMKFHDFLKSSDKPKDNSRKNKKSLWNMETWQQINIYQPLTWLLLPFLLFPLILRFFLWLIINTNTTTTTTTSNEPTAGQSNNSSDDLNPCRTPENHHGLSILRRKTSS